jgi:hypothetical protein
VLKVSFSPILPFGTSFSLTETATFASCLSQITEEMWQDTAVDFLGLFVSYTVAKALSIGLQAAGLIAIGVKGALQWAMFITLLPNDPEGSTTMLAVFFAKMLMRLVAIATSVGQAFAQAIWNVCTAPMVSAWDVGSEWPDKIRCSTGVF